MEGFAEEVLKLIESGERHGDCILLWRFSDPAKVRKFSELIARYGAGRSENDNKVIIQGEHFLIKNLTHNGEKWAVLVSPSKTTPQQKKHTKQDYKAWWVQRLSEKGIPMKEVDYVHSDRSVSGQTADTFLSEIEGDNEKRGG